MMRLFNEGSLLLFKTGHRAEARTICKETFDRHLGSDHVQLSRLALQCGVNDLRAASIKVDLGTFSALCAELEEYSVAVVKGLTAREISKLRLSISAGLAARIRRQIIDGGSYESISDYSPGSWNVANTPAKVLDRENSLEHAVRCGEGGIESVLDFFLRGKDSDYPQLMIYLFRTGYRDKEVLSRLTNWIESLGLSRPNYRMQLIAACTSEIETSILPESWVNEVRESAISFRLGVEAAKRPDVLPSNLMKQVLKGMHDLTLHLKDWQDA